MPPFSTFRKSGLALAVSQLINMGADAATLTVNSNSDSLDTESGSSCTLRKAVESINEGALKTGCSNTGSEFGNTDTILLDASLSNQTITLAGSQLDIGKASGDAIEVTIQGNSATIDGDLKSRVMQVQAGDTLILDSVTISRGSTLDGDDSNSNGGGIELKEGARLTLSNSTLSNNIARRRGGAISASVTSSQATPYALLINTTVTQNESRLNTGGGLHFSNADLKVENSVLSHNTAKGETASGGGASLIDGRFEFNNVVISQNQASTAGGRIGSGGGLDFDGGAGHRLILTNATVSGNTTFGRGGGIRVRAYDETSIEISNTTISGNSAVANASASGGGVSVQGSSGVHFRNVTIAENIARDNANVLQTSGLSIPSFSINVVTLENTIVSAPAGMRACETGGGVFQAGQDNIIERENCATDARTVNPRLGAVSENGGLTQTHRLLSGSPAINTGNNALCEPLDQRGETRSRNAGDRCDLGALEVQSETVFFVVPTQNGNTVVFEL